VQVLVLVDVLAVLGALVEADVPRI
jgi:hypothetical protein